VANNNQINAEILRKETVLKAIGISNSTLYAWMDSGLFPKPIQLGPRAVGWLESEIAAWVEARTQKRNITQTDKSNSLVGDPV
jgi:prophage regulatory protein